MKGTFFQKPMEYSLFVDGESWRQGDLIKGTLGVKNHGTEVLPLAGTKVHLAFGAFSKVQAKAANAFKIQSSVELGEGVTLSPQQSESFSWQFPLDRNCTITEKSASPYLLCGQGDDLSKYGHIQVKILPFALIEEFLKILSIDLRFVFKSQRSHKGWVEAKFAPPESKAFATVEQLLLLFRFEGEQLQLRYEFAVKRLDASAGMVLEKKKKQFEKNYSPKEYLTITGRLHRDAMEAGVREVMSQLGSTGVLS